MDRVLVAGAGVFGVTAAIELRKRGHPVVLIASGDSGHAFKFAPVMGPLIADVVQGRPGRSRFAWRPGLHPERWEEATRSQT